MNTRIVSIIMQIGITVLCPRPSEYPKAIAAALPNMTSVAVIPMKICESSGVNSSLIPSQKVNKNASVTPISKSLPSGVAVREIFV